MRQQEHRDRGILTCNSAARGYCRGRADWTDSVRVTELRNHAGRWNVSSNSRVRGEGIEVPVCRKGDEACTPSAATPDFECQAAILTRGITSRAEPDWTRSRSASRPTRGRFGRSTFSASGSKTLSPSVEERNGHETRHAHPPHNERQCLSPLLAQRLQCCSSCPGSS